MQFFSFVISFVPTILIWMPKFSMMTLKYYYYFALFLFSLMFYQCDFYKNTKILDLSGSNLEISINRFEKKFEAIDTNNLVASLKNLRAQDSLFFDSYTIQMMRFGKFTDTPSVSNKYIREFLTNKDVQNLHDSVSEKFKNIKPLEAELTEAMKYFEHYFPEKPIPEVHSVISEFSYNAVTFDSATIVIALDMFMGKDFSIYRSIDFPRYKINRFAPEYIVPNTMEVLYSQHFGRNELAETNAMVYEMIEKGKKLYFLESMMPEKPKHILIGYKAEQLEWCEASESDIWAFYNDKDLFYSKSYIEHKKHIDDGPRTAGMPKEAPGNVGSWVGWQIVNAYMKNAGENVSLKQLLKTPAKDIMNKSRYKPA